MSIDSVQTRIGTINREAVGEDHIKHALDSFADVFTELPAYQRKELVRLLINRAVVTAKTLTLEFHGRSTPYVATRGSKRPKREKNR